jgi:ABC-type spermidine/putrescine transport system permease subunit I
MATQTLARRHATAVPRQSWLSTERLVMLGAVAALLLLVVYPALYLIWGSVSQEGAFTLEHFRRAFSSPLYYNALLNTVYLGAGVAAPPARITLLRIARQVAS